MKAKDAFNLQDLDTCLQYLLTCNDAFTTTNKLNSIPKQLCDFIVQVNNQKNLLPFFLSCPFPYAFRFLGRPYFRVLFNTLINSKN